MHVPVMLRECLEYLAIRPDGVYLDATCGIGRAYRSHRAAADARVWCWPAIAMRRVWSCAQGEHGGLRRSHSLSQSFVFAVGRERWQPKGFHKWTDCWRTWAYRGTS